MDGIDLPYNKTLKQLGITLDEHIDFNSHIANIEAKATKALTVIREVKGISGVGSKILLKLYVTLVRSIMEYGSTIWQTELSPWERVQRKGPLCLGLPSTAGREAVEVASGTIDLRFAEIAVRDIEKGAEKRNDEPVKKLLNDCLKSETSQGRQEQMC